MIGRKFKFPALAYDPDCVWVITDECHETMAAGDIPPKPINNQRNTKWWAVNESGHFKMLVCTDGTMNWVD